VGVAGWVLLPPATHQFEVGRGGVHGSNVLTPSLRLRRRIYLGLWRACDDL
jgi:hypothetical protein